MSQLYLFALASQNAKWLHARQSLVAENVANANTPGYKAVDLKPFSAVLEKAEQALDVTSPAHFSGFVDEAARSEQSDASEITLSGNSVGLESEMAKLGEINRNLSLSTNLQRVFHQMLMTAVK